KEDIAKITREVEQVKHEYARRLESLAHQNRLVLEQGSRRHQLRMAALDRRLEVHQQAYTFGLGSVGRFTRKTRSGPSSSSARTGGDFTVSTSTRQFARHSMTPMWRQRITAN